MSVQTPTRKMRGFTIVESMVAITILISAIVGVSSAIRTGISSYTFSRDQITAFYLAQEGFEFIRNMRDENALKSRGWLTGFSANSDDPCYFGNACIVDPIRSNTPTRCSAPGGCPVIRQGGTNSFFGYNSGWPASKFRREIVLTPINANEISVAVSVNWAHGTANKQFAAKENLFNWP